jgi:hypothetical protein
MRQEHAVFISRSILTDTVYWDSTWQIKQAGCVEVKTDKYYGEVISPPYVIKARYLTDKGTSTTLPLPH